MRYKEILESMNEAIRTPTPVHTISRNIPYAKQALMQDDTKVGELNGYDLRSAELHGVYFLGASKGDELVSFLMINPNIYKYPSIDLSWTDEGARGQGIMKGLIKYWVANNGPLISDYEQSGSAEAMWKSLIKNPMGLKIKVYNNDTGEISDLNDPNNPWSQDPWDDDTGDLHMMAEKKSKKKQKSILVPLIIEACGKIVQGVNTTVDVGLDEITKQAAKFGNKVSRNGYPPLIREGEELNELVHSGHQEEHGPVSKIVSQFEDDIYEKGKPVGNIQGYTLIFANLYGGSDHLYGLLGSNDELIALVLLNMTDNYFPTIATTWVDQQYRGKGLMKGLFAYFLNEYDSLISDSSQSTQAKGMWKSLIKNPPSGYKVVVWNTKTQQTAEIGGNEPWAKDPWDGSYDTHLMLTRG